MKGDGLPSKPGLLRQNGALPLASTRIAQTCAERAGADAHVIATQPLTTLLAAGLIVLCIVASYYNSLSGCFIFDDDTAIVSNEAIRRFWPVWVVLAPTAGGQTVSGRPLLNFSLAVNYALGELNVWGRFAGR